MMTENTFYKNWLRDHEIDLNWIVEMAYNGIKVTPGAGDHPSNVFLYMLQCDLQEIHTDMNDNEEGIE